MDQVVVGSEVVDGVGALGEEGCAEAYDAAASYAVGGAVVGAVGAAGAGSEDGFGELVGGWV